MSDYIIINVLFCIILTVAFLLSTNFIMNILIFFLICYLVYMSIWMSLTLKDIKKITTFCDDTINDKNEVNPIFSKNDEINSLNIKVAQMRMKLISINDTKTSMIQNISHNLKSPLSSILLAIELLKDEEIPANQIGSYYDKIYTVANKMLFDIQRLLNLNKLNFLISQKKQCKDTVDMKEIVITCLYNFDHYFESHKIEVQLNLYNSQFYGTEEHWEDLVMNLLENASRYARSYVKIDLHKNSLSIFNDGDSIENIDSIFDPYQKGKNGKTGLGLSIVKSICTLYDYNVLVKNKDGGVLFKIYREKETE